MTNPRSKRRKRSSEINPLNHRGHRGPQRFSRCGPSLFVNSLSKSGFQRKHRMPGRSDCHSVTIKPAFLPPPRSSVSSVVAPFWVFVFLATTMLGCMGGEPKHPTWKNATGAEQYERLMWQAFRDKDWKEAEYRLAPTFVGVIASGQALDRTGWIAHWQANPIKDFSLGDVSVQPNGQDMTVTYVLHLAGNGTASVQHEGLRVVSVWQHVKGGWVLITTSQTPAVEP